MYTVYVLKDKNGKLYKGFLNIEEEKHLQQKRWLISKLFIARNTRISLQQEKESYILSQPLEEDF